LTNFRFVFYDLGSIDDPGHGLTDTVHMITLYIEAMRPPDSLGVPKLSGTVYGFLQVDASNKVIDCPVKGAVDVPHGRTEAVTATDASGNWVIVRAGDLVTASPPRTGTIDYYVGTGPLTSPAAAIQPPAGYGAPTPQNFFIQLNGTTWTGMGYKVW
jgi:hypothetical protein